MILGVDLGNFAVKTSRNINFPAKCATTPGILRNTVLTLDKTYYIGEGNIDTEYRKINKTYLKPLFYYALLQSTSDQHNRVIVGLPLSQYRQDKDVLKQILSGTEYVNSKKLYTEVEVYPEGLGAVAGSDYQGVIVDIGGRTTDACEVKNGKVNNPYSMPKGTLNLYSDFIKILNTNGLDLQADDAQGILDRGLKVDGAYVDIKPAMEIFKQFVDELIGELQLAYSVRTRDVLLVGGGCKLLYQAIKNRIPGASIINNPLFANAIGFQRAGELLWQ